MRGTSEALVRRALASDETDIREIDFETGFFGRSMAALIDSRSLFDYAVEPFLPSRGGIAFVATADGKVVGYVVASLRVSAFATALAAARAYLSALLRWSSLTPRDRKYVKARAAAALRAACGPERRFRTPGGARLHINLLPEARGAHAGSRLLEALFEELRNTGGDLVHANSYQTKENLTHSFWTRNGFVEHSRVRTSAWRGLGVAADVDLVCYRKALRGS